MLEFLLKKRIEDVLKNKFNAENYKEDYFEIKVTSDSFRKELNRTSIYFLLSSDLDIPITARVKMFSADNIINMSKEEIRFDTQHRVEEFSDYIDITTTDYGAEFKPFKLKFLEITPY